MADFPVRKLPLIVQEMIVGFMELKYLIKGSLVSPYFNTLVKRANVKIEIADWRELHPDYSFSLKTANEGLSFRFHWASLNEPQDIERYQRFHGNLHIYLSERRVGIYNSNPNYSRLEDYRFIMDMVFDTFHVDTFCAGEYQIRKELLFPFAHRYRNMVRELYLIQSSQNNSCAPLLSEDLSQLLNNLQVENMEVRWKIVHGSSFPKPMKAKSLMFSDAACFTIDDLMVLDCQRFTAYGVLLSAEDLKMFILEWQKEGFSRLEEIHFIGYSSNWTTVLDGVVTLESEVVANRTDRQPQLRREVHRSDGKKALVIVYERNFIFRVLN